MKKILLLFLFLLVPSVNATPGFTLTTNADFPNVDGSFALSWTVANDAYILYNHTNLITEINSSVGIVQEGITENYFVIYLDTNATTYYAVSFHDILSNSIRVVTLRIENSNTSTRLSQSTILWIINSGLTFFVVLSFFIVLALTVIIKRKSKKKIKRVITKRELYLKDTTAENKEYRKPSY